MAWTPDPKTEDLMTRLAARRRETLSQSMAQRREHVVNDFTHRGVRGGAMVVAIGKVYVEAFNKYAAGVVDDWLDVVAPGASIDIEAAEGLRERLNDLLDRMAASIINSVSEGAQTEGLRTNVEQAMQQQLQAAKRDVGIRLDTLAVRGQQSPVAVVDDAMKDTLVPLLNRRALEAHAPTVLTRAASTSQPVAVLFFDI